MELEPPEATLVMLETDAETVVGRDWYIKLDKVFINNLGKYRKYKGGSVRDLLRAMRNKVSVNVLFAPCMQLITELPQKHHYQGKLLPIFCSGTMLILLRS